MMPTWISSKIVVAENGCWQWTGRLTDGGYGGCTRNGENVAHRAVYRELVGPIPDGHDLDHECHNRDTACVGGITCLHRRCVNPTHVAPATRRENLLRGNTIPALNAAKTTCVRGHNRWRIRKDNGTRQCLECKRLDEAERNRKKRVS